MGILTYVRAGLKIIDLGNTLKPIWRAFTDSNGLGSSAANLKFM